MDFSSSAALATLVNPPGGARRGRFFTDNGQNVLIGVNTTKGY